MSKKVLWQSTPLPDWSTPEIFELFHKVNTGTQTQAEEEDYVKLLMVLISAFMGRGKWFYALRSRRIDEEGVASDILSHIREKTPKISLQHNDPKVLLAFLNRMIFNQVIAALRKQKFVPDSLPLTAWGDENEKSLTYLPRRDFDPLSMLGRHLKDSESLICEGKWKDQISICVMYRFLCRQIVRQNTILPHSQLPTRLRKRVNLEQHAQISFRLNRAIREFAADL